MSFKGSQQTAMVDKLLTNVSNGYFPEGFVSESLLTPLDVVQSSGILPSYGKGHLRIVNTKQVGRGKPRLANLVERVTDRKYFIEKHALQGEVTEDDYNNVEEPFKAEEDEVQALKTTLMVEKEYTLASTLTDTAVLTQNVTLSGTSQLSDYSASSPVTQFKNALKAIFDGCGRKANRAVVPYGVLLTLQYHPEILENLGFAANRAGQLTSAEICKAMGVDEIFVPEALYNSAKEGQADVMAPIWGKHIVFMHAPKAPAKQQTSLGYYVKTKGGSNRVKKWNINESFGNTGILLGDNYSFEIIDPSAAYLIKNAIA